jgi:GT2 family glycosyltransferase
VSEHLDEPIDVALIVVTYNSADVIDGLLSSLDAGLGSLRAQVVIVDNSSSDATVDRLSAVPGLDVVPLADNRGYSAGINVGLERTADAPAVLVLNPDLRLGAGSVARLLETARQPSVGVVVPQMQTPEGAIYHSLRREPTCSRALGAAVLGGRVAARFPRLSETVVDDRTYLVPGDVDWATGAAMLMTRACLDAVGPWDESFFLYSEETDYADRARRAGFRIRYEPAAVVSHKGGESMTSPRLRSMLALNRVRYFRRRHGRLRSSAFYSAVLLNEASRGLIGNRAARAAAASLIRPTRRPVELAAAGRLLPT